MLITPPPIDLDGRREYARYNYIFCFFVLFSQISITRVILLLACEIRSMYGDKVSKVADRTNEVTGTYAEQCVAIAKELGLPSINLWSKMQETNGWQRTFLRLVIESIPFRGR